MNHFNGVGRNFQEENGVVKPNMHEIHTGHLPKPQFATVSGPLEMQRQPQRARVQSVDYIAPQKFHATLWEPPKMQYTQHYSRVENRSSDLNKELYPDPEDEHLTILWNNLRKIKGFPSN